MHAPPDTMRQDSVRGAWGQASCAARHAQSAIRDGTDGPSIPQGERTEEYRREKRTNFPVWYENELLSSDPGERIKQC
jgi:hypothetical protein